MAVQVDQSRLVLNSFAAIFQNNLISADFVQWKMYNEEMADRNGLLVSEQVGPRYAVTQTTSGVTDLSAGVQDTVFGSEQFVVNQVFGSSMGWGDFVKIRDIGEARESTAIKNAAINLAERIDAYILKTVVLASNNYVGTIGNPVSTWDAFVSAYTRLKEEGVDDSDLRAVLPYADRQALGTYVVNNNSSSLSEADGIFRKGFTGDIAGIPVAFTQQLPVLTTGTRSGAPAINGAAQNVNYKAVSTSAAPGQYMSQLLSVNGLGATDTINDGEVFTIAGVFAYDNRSGNSLGRLQQFRVIGNYTAVAGAVAALRVYPAIIVPGSGSGGDINVNNANGTCTVAPAGGALMTFLGVASTGYKPRAIIQKEAVVINTADLIMPATGMASRKTLTKLPLSIRMWKDSLFNTGDHRVRFDVALTANVRDRRRVCRLNGA